MIINREISERINRLCRFLPDLKIHIGDNGMHLHALEITMECPVNGRRVCSKSFLPPRPFAGEDERISEHIIHSMAHNLLDEVMRG